VCTKVYSDILPRFPYCLIWNLTLRSLRNTLSADHLCVFNPHTTSPISPSQKDRKHLESVERVRFLVRMSAWNRGSRLFCSEGFPCLRVGCADPRAVDSASTEIQSRLLLSCDGSVRTKSTFVMLS
jgi:hypothetical protein